MRSPSRKILEIDGLRSIVERRGRPDAPVVVLMASMLIRPRSYARLVQRLAKSFHVVTIEPPGTGRASKLPTPWTFQDYADRLGRTLDALDLRDITLIGHSNSAAVAMLAAAHDHPASQRIARIVLADSVGGDPRHGFWRIGLGRVLDGVFEAGFSITAVADVFWNLAVHRANFLFEIHQAIHWDAVQHAGKVHVPTLLAWGARDLTFFPWVARRLNGMMPHARLYTFARGHHDWLAVQPAEFALMLETARY
jgi:pimeloyl-ACP methyl ester carboxylesterase